MTHHSQTKHSTQNYTDIKGHFLKTTVRNIVSMLDFIVHNKIEHKYIVAYGGFKKSISGYTRDRMQNPTIKLKDIFHTTNTTGKSKD
jgi:hypothetical protein